MRTILNKFKIPREIRNPGKLDALVLLLTNLCVLKSSSDLLTRTELELFQLFQPARVANFSHHPNGLFSITLVRKLHLEI